MNILEKIKKDIEEAQKEKNDLRLQTLRLLTAEIHNFEISKRTKSKDVSLVEEEVVQIIQKEIKKRKEAKELFLAGGRQDLVQKTEDEIKILEEYAPKMMTRDEILKAINELKNQGFSDFNSLIKEIMKRYKGKVDGQEVANLIRDVIK